MTLVLLNDSATAQEIDEDKIGKQIVDAAFRVHSVFGPGLLESVYEICLIEELTSRGLSVESQKPVSVVYNNKKLDAGFRVDLLVENSVIVELKTVEAVLPVHQAQILTYLNLSDKKLGYLINFNVPLIKDGIKRMVRRK